MIEPSITTKITPTSDVEIIPVKTIEEEDDDENNKIYYEEDFENLPENLNKFSLLIMKITEKISTFTKSYGRIIKLIIKIIILCLYIALFIWFIICKLRIGTLIKIEDNIRFIWISCLIFAAIIYKFIRFLLNKYPIKTLCKKDPVCWDKCMTISLYVFCGIATAIIIGYMIYSAVKYDPYNLTSLSGICLLMFLGFIFSKSPHMINWRQVLLGILMQFIFAMLIMGTRPGYEVFKFLGDRVSEFLDHTEAGVKFVFGDDFFRHPFAFRILPVITFMSSVTAILYYLGVIQVVIVFLGNVMQRFIGTTCGESMNAVANIFLSMQESPLLIRPLLGRMTNSELHAVLTGGFSTIAGSLLATYINYGAPANHLISASVMSAPAALAISKLMYPETKKSKLTKDDAKNIPKPPYNNLIEAATVGALDSIPIIAGITATLISFLAILSFFNGLLKWLGDRACLESELSFELICSYIFWPLTLCMGVKIEDCQKVAELIGIKTFLNEFLAYEKFKKMSDNKKFIATLDPSTSITYELNKITIKFINGTIIYLKDGILHADRSLVIATYALCGFSNIGAMGMMLSSLSTLVPHRRTDLTQMVVRAMIAGNIACFLTASIAGLFYQPL